MAGSYPVFTSTRASFKSSCPGDLGMNGFGITARYFFHIMG